MWLRWRPHVAIFYTVWRTPARTHRSAHSTRVKDNVHVMVEAFAPLALRAAADNDAVRVAVMIARLWLCDCMRAQVHGLTTSQAALLAQWHELKDIVEKIQLCDRALVHLCCAPVDVEGSGLARDAAMLLSQAATPIGSTIEATTGPVSAAVTNSFTFFRALSSLDISYWSRWFRVHRIEGYVGQGCSTFEEWIIDAVIQSHTEGRRTFPQRPLTLAASYALLQEVCGSVRVLQTASVYIRFICRAVEIGLVYWYPTLLLSEWSHRSVTAAWRIHQSRPLFAFCESRSVQSELFCCIWHFLHARLLSSASYWRRSSRRFMKSQLRALCSWQTPRRVQLLYYRWPMLRSGSRRKV